jgi:hypothetical protein
MAVRARHVAVIALSAETTLPIRAEEALMKLSDPIHASQVKGSVQRLLAVAFVLGAIAFVLDQLHQDYARPFGIAAAIFFMLGFFAWKYIWPDARNDDLAMALNERAEDAQPLRRVGT